MKGFNKFSRWMTPQWVTQFNPNQRWGLLLLPLASIGSIPLWLALQGQVKLPESVESPPAPVALSPEAASNSASVINLPPLSQIPAPPTQETSNLQAPRPVTAKSSPADKKLPDPLPTSAVKPKPAEPEKVTTTTSPPVTTPKPASAKLPASQPVAAPTAKTPASIATVNYTPPPLEIRVGVQRDVPSVAIAASKQGTLMDRTGKALMTLAPNQNVIVRSSGSSLVINGRNFPGVVWLTASNDGYLAVGDRWYRGRVLLVSRGDKVLAVNYVDLEHYLTSVVGSEMHTTAPTEALKAQAIAARSYALVHMVRPASDWFDLGDTQRWQVYKGIKSEFETSHGAVIATLGQVLSHNGGVVESLYASTDEIVSRVHKGRGMSQYGAYDLARQGYNYQQILSRYYPGVVVARVILKQ